MDCKGKALMSAKRLIAEPDIRAARESHSTVCSYLSGMRIFRRKSGSGPQTFFGFHFHASKQFKGVRMKALAIGGG